MQRIIALTETFPDTGVSVVLPAKYVSGPEQGQWTYQEYLDIPEDGRRYEVMNGVLIMAPSPTGAHQAAVVRFAHYLFQLVELAGIGKVYVAPFDVVLTPKHVVQPDALVILEKSLARLSSANMQGGPDIVVEIASPGTATYDRLSKYDAYEQAGVSEYWLADPAEKSIELLLLEHDHYRSLGTFKGKDTLPSRAVPTIADVPVERFFA